MAVGAVVEIVRVTLVALVVMLPELLALDELNRQFASLGKPEQVYVTGMRVCALDPVPTTNPAVLLTTICTGPVVCP